MRDLFKIASFPDVGVGGWYCYCCNPLPTRGGKRGKQKKKYHHRARARMKKELIDERENKNEDF